MAGCLYVAATPIGNLSDTSQRLADVLSGADLVLVEDTRVSGRLLGHLGIRRPMRSLHEHNETQSLDSLLGALSDGQTLVLISDAGTPLVSDPGYRLISAARDAGIGVIPVPGPSAVTAALSVAGLPTHAFSFHGFLSPKRGERRRQLAELGARSETQVLFEACHRIDALVDDAIAELGPERTVFVGREMTKRHEQYVRASLSAIQSGLRSGEMPKRGEFVLIIAGAEACASSSKVASVQATIAALAAELPPSQAARIGARLTGLSRRECFDRIEDLKSGA